MENGTIVKNYLESRNIAAACRTENVFIYQAQLQGESRVSGCEVLIREVGEDLVLTPEQVKILKTCALNAMNDPYHVTPM